MEEVKIERDKEEEMIDPLFSIWGDDLDLEVKKHLP